MSSTPLRGATVVVTRPADQAGPLVDALRRAGATPIEVPTLVVEEAADGGAALRSALTLTAFGWVVVSSANGARFLARAIGATGATLPRVAAVGPRTAEVLDDLGITVDLVPGTFVAEGLVDAFPEGRDAVLVVRPETARSALADGLRAKGHGVTEVVAYRTARAPIEPATAAAARTADVVTFTSPLAYGAYVDAVGLPVDQVVVSIGPVTTAAIADTGVGGVVEADPHTTDAMVDALVDQWSIR